MFSMWVCADQDYVDQDLTFRLSSRSRISCALLDRAIGSGADQADTQSLSKQTNSLGVDWCASEWERAETGVRAGPFSCGNDLERASRRFATSGVEVYIMFGAAKKLDVRRAISSNCCSADTCSNGGLHVAKSGPSPDFVGLRVRAGRWPWGEETSATPLQC